MAIGLSDLSHKKEIKKEVIQTTPVVEEVLVEEPMKQQRPWDSKQQAQKSSVANLAVKRAREISEKNDQFASELRKNFINSQKELELNRYLENREKEFVNLDNSRKLHVNRNRIITHRSLLKRIRDSLFR